MPDEISGVDSSKGVDLEKRRTIKLLGAAITTAAISFTLPTSSSTDNPTSEISSSESDDPEKTIEDIRDEILLKHGVEVFVPDKDIQLYDLIDKFRRSKSSNPSDTDEIDGIPYDVASIAWKVLNSMNTKSLSYDEDNLLTERNVGVLRSIPVAIQRPTLEDMDFAQTALDLLPKSLYDKLYTRSNKRVRFFMLRGMPQEHHAGGLSLHLHNPGPFYRRLSASGTYYGSDLNDHDFIVDMNMLKGHSPQNLRQVQWALGTVVHELFHGIAYEASPTAITHSGRKIDGPTYLLDPYTLNLLDILGFIRTDPIHGRVADIDGFMNMLEIHGQVHKEYDKDGRVSYPNNTYLGYGGSKNNRYSSIALNELLSVTAKMYLHGRQDFTKEFADVFGAHRAERLYEYMRDTFYEGRDFKEDELKNIAREFSERHTGR